MLIDFVPTTAGVSLADAEGFKKAAGGAPANVAVGISRLGGSAAFMGKVIFFMLPSAFIIITMHVELINQVKGNLHSRRSLINLNVDH